MEKISLYIHIPFCKNKCFYCDFPSFSGCDGQMINYAKALSKEIDNVSLSNYIIETIFIGGGTPTYFSLDAINILAKSIKKLNLSKNIEFTVEGNPGTFTKEKLEAFKKMGVNRLSIGLQACQNNLLKKIGRIHTFEEFIESYDMARESGFENINVDLMFGLPNQTVEMWEESLNKIINLKPEHLSCYSLIIEEGTPFYNLFEKDILKLPSEEDERKMNLKTLEILKKNGYIQYEISNYAKPGKECRHNLVYWDVKPYIGCGSSAHSYINEIRYSNENNISYYIEKMNKKGNAIIYKEKNNIKDNMEEFMFLGLRKINGINKNTFKERFNSDIYEVYGKIINKYVKLGLMSDEKNSIYLTKRGIEVSNSIMCEFIFEKD